MNKTEFQRLYLGDFSLPERDGKLYEIAKFYHETCESFDRGVCTGPVVRGVIRPASDYELRAINKYAYAVRKQCVAAGAKIGFTREEVFRAIKKYHE